MANNDLADEFRERLRGRLWSDKSNVAYVPERDDPIFEAMDAATEVFTEMAEDLRNTPDATLRPRYDARLNDDDLWFVWDRIGTRQVGSATVHQDEAEGFARGLNELMAYNADQAPVPATGGPGEVERLRAENLRLREHALKLLRERDDAIRVRDGLIKERVTETQAPATPDTGQREPWAWHAGDSVTIDGSHQIGIVEGPTGTTSGRVLVSWPDRQRWERHEDLRPAHEPQDAAAQAPAASEVIHAADCGSTWPGEDRCDCGAGPLQGVASPPGEPDESAPKGSQP